MDEHYLGIMFEEMKGNFKLVLEGHAVLDNKIEALSRNTAESFNEMNIKFEFLNEKIEQNTASIDALSDRVDSVEENLSARIDAVDKKLSTRIDSVPRHLIEDADLVV